jgi:hypothetical protein
MLVLVCLHSPAIPVARATVQEEEKAKTEETEETEETEALEGDYMD